MIGFISNAAALASLPAHTPEWTNFNQGDPGPTVLEAMVWPLDLSLYGPVQPSTRRAIDAGHGVADGLSIGQGQGSASVSVGSGVAVSATGDTIAQDDVDRGRPITFARNAPARTSAA